MSKLKALAMLTSILAIALPSLAVAELWNDKRYICLTSQAAGWKKDAKHTDLDLTDPQTQYIIEPLAMVVKAAHEAKEGYFEVPISHSVKQVGSTETKALCVDSVGSLECFWWHSEVSGDLENAIISTIKEFKLHVGREIDDPIFMTRINTASAYFGSGRDRGPYLEVGECKQF